MVVLCNRLNICTTECWVSFRRIKIDFLGSKRNRCASCDEDVPAARI
jgi:hypothetical protein